MNCSKCKSELTIRNISVQNCRDCSACNLGIFSGGRGCDCEYYTENREEQWCENCNIQFFLCKRCNLPFEQLVHMHCDKCIQYIKNNNPSTIDRIYYFDDAYVKWILHYKKCHSCDNMEKAINFRFKSDSCNNCESKRSLEEEYNKIKNNSNGIEYIICGKEIKGRKTCICGLYTDWINNYYITANSGNFLQCRSCDPSTKLSIYKYYNNIWTLQKSGKKCKLCSTILWIDHDKKEHWGDLIQCNVCKPINTHIKFKQINGRIGYEIDKIKVFSNCGHRWKNPTCDTTVNYICECTKCKC